MGQVLEKLAERLIETLGSNLKTEMSLPSKFFFTLFCECGVGRCFYISSVPVSVV